MIILRGRYLMTIEEAAALAKLPAAQARVMYKPGDCETRRGTVMAVDGSDVFVRFDGEPASRATRPEDLAVIGPGGTRR